ncbi:hypothetical protein BX600DRAFT_523411 [Xylariales sp. PMI_506]|nr:hypothetical protein BX600DRAFT_523411 [Xylariales sp. PMI_506]
MAPSDDGQVPYLHTKLWDTFYISSNNPNQTYESRKEVESIVSEASLVRLIQENARLEDSADTLDPLPEAPCSGDCTVNQEGIVTHSRTCDSSCFDAIFAGTGDYISDRPKGVNFQVGHKNSFCLRCGRHPNQPSSSASSIACYGTKPQPNYVKLRNNKAFLNHIQNEALAFSSAHLIIPDTSEAYMFQTPMYGSKSPEWSLYISVRNTGDFERRLQLYTEKAAGNQITKQQAYCFEDGMACMKTVAILEVNDAFKVDELLEDVKSLMLGAAGFRHPLLPAVQLLLWHIRETAELCEQLKTALDDIVAEINNATAKIDGLLGDGENPSVDFESIQKELHKCRAKFERLELRLGFEQKFGKTLLEAICWGYKKCLVSGQHIMPVTAFAHINKLERIEKLAELIETSLSSNTGSFDVRFFPAQIKFQEKRLGVLQNLKENKEMRKLAKLALSDSTSMRTITAITTIFLPGTFVASITSNTLFEPNKESGWPSLTNMFWVYWCVTIPLTIVVVLIWQYWVRRWARKMKGADAMRPPSSIREVHYEAMKMA